METTRHLTKFFMLSSYKKPNQRMLQIVLLVALMYALIQIAVLNIAIYYLTATSVFMFYNVVFSSIVTYILTCYLSVTQIFSYNEFGVMASLPISYRKISQAKLNSGIIVPIVLAIIVQIPAYGLLIIDMKMIELLKLIFLLPIINGCFVFLLLYVLSVINTFYYKFKNKITYLIMNLVVMGLFPIALIILYNILTTGNKIPILIENTDLKSMMGWTDLINSLLNHILENIMTIPLLNTIVGMFVSNHISIPIILTCLILIILFYYAIIQQLSVNYFKNGLHETTENHLKSSKVHMTKNKWLNYLQREIWVIKSETYFKMQVIVGVLLPPVISLFILLLVENEGFLNFQYITEEGMFVKFFSYTVLFFCCMNNISGTPYSREGKYYHLLKSHPFNPTRVYFSKVIIASAMSCSAVFLSFMLLAIFGYWGLETIVLLLIISGLVICYNLLTPLFDMRNPLTEWEQPSVAVKSNPNVLVSLLYGMPILLVVVSIHFSLLWVNINSILVSIFILLVVLVIVAMLIKKLKISI